jgi:hypothetical protein
MIAGREYGQIAVPNVGYARVSTIDQNPALQLDALAAARASRSLKIAPQERGLTVLV